MAIFDIKSLQPSEPVSLYSTLRTHIDLGESEATSLLEEKNGRFYLLGGLDIENLNESGLSEETVGRLMNALETDKVRYALFSRDQRQNQLPLILDKKSREYITYELPELLNNQYIRWYMFKLPTNIDPDDNEKEGSLYVLDEQEKPLSIEFKDIKTYIEEHGYVNKDESEDEAFLEDVESEEDTNEKDENDNQDHSFDNELALGVVSDDHKYEASDNTDNESVENLTTAEDNVDKDEAFDAFFGNKDDDQMTDEAEQNVNIEESNVEQSDDNPLGLNEEDLVDEDDSTNLEDTTQAVDVNGELLLDESGKAFDEIPELLQRVLDSIHLPRIKSYKTTGVYGEQKEQINDEIDTYNSRILERENSIKNKIIQSYQTRLNDSYEAITSKLDVETGDEVVKAKYQAIQEAKTQAEQAGEEEIAQEQARLIEDFKGPKYEAYKERILAELPQKFEDEYYAEYVALPLESFKEDIESKTLSKKADIDEEFYEWKDGLKKAALTSDQKRSVSKVSHEVEPLINDARKEISSFQKDTSNKLNELIALAIQERANESAKEALKKEMAEQMASDAIKEKEEALSKEKAKMEDSKQETTSKIAELENELDALRRQEKAEKEDKERKLTSLEDENQRLRRERMELEDNFRNQRQQPLYQPMGQDNSQNQFSDQASIQQPQNQQSELENNKDSKKLQKEKTRKRGNKGFAFGSLGGIFAGVILGAGILFGVGNMNEDDTQSNNQSQPAQEQQTKNTSSSDNSKLPADDYKEGNILKNVETDGKKEDLVIDKVNKDDSNLMVHKKSDSKDKLDPNKDKKDYTFYTVPVEKSSK